MPKLLLGKFYLD